MLPWLKACFFLPLGSSLEHKATRGKLENTKENLDITEYYTIYGSLLLKV
jgi:hypothetical protein